MNIKEITKALERYPRKVLDSAKPAFEKGKPLGFMRSFFEAFESFLYSPKSTTSHGTHIRDANDMKRTMILVMIALIPCMLFGMWNIGFQRLPRLDELGEIIPRSILNNWGYGFLRMLPSILVTYIVGVAIECGFAQWRGEEVNEGFFVTGMLIPLILPIGTPLWMTALAVAFSVVIGKEIFGGTGMNIFNPALLARLFIFFAYTPFISGETVWYADAHSGATALSQLADTGATGYSLWDAFIGTIPGSVGETSKICILLGAILLLWTGVASWRTMTAVFAGGLLMGLIFNLCAPAVPESAREIYMALPAWQHLLFGGFAFGAVFMATDPVTSAQTNAGKWIYGIMIGMLAILVRVMNPGYPEGMMLAIILMNGVAPLIDHLVVGASIRRRCSRKVKTAKL
ncbi:MAG: NADH:ubiquinone reductase (Na(+)-transporting) subunit B [Tidjanibacter sp.]|nr:NADH:ubiquinone reductase (Na(+)-transporting) subunit B [Tidjanibacter sp.]